MPVNFGQLQNQIDEMYEEKSEDVKKMYSPQDFTEEIHNSIMRTLKKSGINPTKEAIQDALIGIKELSAYYDLTQEGAIESLSITAVSMLKETKYLINDGKSSIGPLLEVGIALKIANDIITPEVLHTMVSNLDSLNQEGLLIVAANVTCLSPGDFRIWKENVGKSIQNLKGEDRKRAEETLAHQDDLDNYKKLLGRKSEEDCKEKVEDILRRGAKDRVEEEIIAMIKQLDGVRSYAEILREVTDYRQSLEAAVSTYDKLRGDGKKPIEELDVHQFTYDFKNRTDASRKFYNIASRDTYNSGYTYIYDNKLKYNDVRDCLDRYHSKVIIEDMMRMASSDGQARELMDNSRWAEAMKQKEAISGYTAATTEETKEDTAIEFKYGIGEIVSTLDKDVNEKTIEEALKLYSAKMKSIFEDKDLAENVKNMGTKDRNSFVKEQIEKISEDGSHSKEVISLYSQLMKLSFKPNYKDIFKDDKSMSDYLEYISQPELAQMIKKGIEDRDKPKEPQEPEPPKEDTPIQPQEAPVPIGNAQMSVLMDLVGGHADGPEIPTFWLGGRESLINKEKENILKVNSMENYLGKVDEGGPVTYDDIKDRFEKKDTLHDLKTTEQLEYNEPTVEAVNELLVGPRGKKLVRNPEEMIQEEVNSMEEVAQDEPIAPDAGEAPKGPEEGVGAPEEPAEINEPETQGVEDAFETVPSENGDIGIDETIPEVEEPAEEVMQEEITQDEPMAPDAGEAPKGPEEGISAPEEPAEINEPETQGVEDAFETAPSENGDIGIDETIPEVEEPAEEVMQEAITQEDVEKMAQEPEKTQEGPQLGETSGVEEAPVPAVISDRQGQLKKLSENVPMRAFREMMDNIKQKMIELKDRITGKNKNPEDRENNDDDFTQ